MISRQLIDQHGIISEQINQTRLTIILHNLELIMKNNQLDGDIVELGCYLGTTSLFIARLIQHYQSKRKFYVYDSFQGLPQKSIQDESIAGQEFQASKLKCSKQDLIKNFKKNNLPLPIIYKTWFNQISDQQLPEKIAFAFLDGDFYDSILDSLNLVWPRLNPEGLIIIDDYERAALPGVSRAINLFFKNKNVVIVNQNNLALIRYQ